MAKENKKLKVGTLKKINLDNVFKSIEYIIATNQTMFLNKTREILDQQDYYEILTKYNEDIKKSSTNLHDIFIVLLNQDILTHETQIDNVKKITDLIKTLETEDIEMPFGKTYTFQKLGDIKFTMVNNNFGEKTVIILDEYNRQVTNFKDILDETDLLIKILKYNNNKFMNSYEKKIPTTSFSFNFKNIESPQVYMKGVKKIIERKELILTIKEMALNLNKVISDIDKSLENKKDDLKYYGRTRATIFDDLKNHIFLRKTPNGSIEHNLKFLKIKDNEQANSKKQKELHNKLLNELIEKFKKNKVFDKIEVANDTSLIEVIKILDNIDVHNIIINSSLLGDNTELGFRIRKLGQQKEGTTGLRTIRNDDYNVIVDLSTAYALIHELSHIVYDIYQKNQELKEYSNTFTSNMAKHMSNIPGKDMEYFYKDTEIFARSGEVAFLLKMIDFTKDIKDPYSDEIYFTKDKLSEIKKKFESNGLIKEFDFYFNVNKKGIYFNLEKMSINDLSTNILFFQDYLGFNEKDKLNIPLENNLKKMTKKIELDFKDSIKGTKISRTINPNIADIIDDFYRTVNRLNKLDSKEFNNVIENNDDDIFIQLLKEDKVISQFTNIEEFGNQYNNLFYDIFVQKQMQMIELTSLIQIEQNKYEDLDPNFPEDRTKRYDISKKIQKLDKTIDSSKNYLNKIIKELNYLSIATKRFLEKAKKDGNNPILIKNLENFKQKLINIEKIYISSKYFNFTYIGKKNYMEQISEDYKSKKEPSKIEDIDVITNDTSEEINGCHFKNDKEEKELISGDDDNKIFTLISDEGKEVYAYRNEIFPNFKDNVETKPNKELKVEDVMDLPYKYFYIFQTYSYSSKKIESDFEKGYEAKNFRPSPKIPLKYLLDLANKDEDFRKDISKQILKIYPNILKEFDKQFTLYINEAIQKIDTNSELVQKLMEEIKQNNLLYIKQKLDDIIENPHKFLEKNINEIIN